MDAEVILQPEEPSLSEKSLESSRYLVPSEGRAKRCPAFDFILRVWSLDQKARIAEPISHLGVFLPKGADSIRNPSSDS